MNIVERMDEETKLPFGLRAFRTWVLERNFIFSLMDLQWTWANKERIIVLKMFEPCFQSAGVSLVFSDSAAGFSTRWVLEDGMALKLMSGREVDFSTIKTVPYVPIGWKQKASL